MRYITIIFMNTTTPAPSSTIKRFFIRFHIYITVLSIKKGKRILNLTL